MLADALWQLLNDQLFVVPSTAALFNQYQDELPGADRPGAAAMRRENLQHYLKSFAGQPGILVIGEAPGYRGARFSGIPLISEAQLRSPDFPLYGQQTSVSGPFTEQTATIYWKLMLPHFGRVFNWNTVPLHPHQPGDPAANRTPTQAEVRQFAPLLTAVYGEVKPEQVVALGRVAARALTMLGIPHTPVRHPAQGGARAFAAGIASILEEQ